MTHQKQHHRRYVIIAGKCSTIVCALLIVLLYTKVQERNHYINALIRTSLTHYKPVTLDDSVKAIALNIYELTYSDYGVRLEDMDWFDKIESTSWFNMTSGTALKYGGFSVSGHYVNGPCGTMSRTLLNCLWDLQIPARKLQLLDNEEGKGGGHTLVEYFSHGKWRVIAPSDNAFTWHNKSGEVATTAEIQQDCQIYKQIYSYNPTYAYLFDNPRHIKWSKLPEWSQNLIKTIIGEESFATMETPRLYDMPRHLMLYMSILLFCISVLVLMPYYISVSITFIRSYFNNSFLTQLSKKTNFMPNLGQQKSDVLFAIEQTKPIIQEPMNSKRFETPKSSSHDLLQKNYSAHQRNSQHTLNKQKQS